jgi:predicted nucleic-acid-binding protein
LIGLDTNILVRYLAQDDAIQSPIASNLLERRLSVAEPGFISVVALVETVWVLQRSYKMRGPALAACVARLLQADVLVVQHQPAVHAAMVAYRDRNADFGDALIALLGMQAGCTHTLTFDRDALRLPGYAAI